MNKPRPPGAKSKPGRLLWLIPILLAALWLVKRGETIRHDHANLADAQSDIARGWIPDSLPPSTAQIHEAHDLDTNLGQGAFTFDSVDAPAFRDRLAPLPADELDRHPHILSQPLIRQGYGQDGRIEYNSRTDIWLSG
jgi:hypothetical protein